MDKLAIPIMVISAWALLGHRCHGQSYAIVDAGQERCYDTHKEIETPAPGERFFGQDAQYTGNAPRYRDNGDGTVTDVVTGLMWQKDPGEKKTWRQAMADAKACRLAGHADWRMPSIKELYSLILFSGTDPDPMNPDSSKERPFINTDYFRFRYGNPAQHERIIDAQYASSTKYVSTTMRGNETVFGVNFADGRIKGYPMKAPRGWGDKRFFVLYVRDNPAYGRNQFEDNGDGTITDWATGLTWMKVDSGHLKAGPYKDGRMNWEQTLAWAENLEYAGHTDWRLPNAKELQSIVDYTRSPDTSGSAAIDPVFAVTEIKNEGGATDYPCYWTGTTHASHRGGMAAVYVAFGRALGWMRERRTGEYRLLDVHGAGAQRSDPKTGDPSRYPHGRGPQGDVIRIYNFVRCVRGGKASLRARGPKFEQRAPAGGDFAKQFIRRMDKNGDGKVSKTEFFGPPRRFSRLDRNRDGYITPEEAPRRPPRGRGARGQTGR